VAKQQTPAPIDRPLSRAYLREFSGWSTAYPPGISEPTSLRIMENVQINRDGSARVRPGLRYLSYIGGGLPTDLDIVGSHEAFFLNDGSKAYLVAVRETDGTVGFRVLADLGDGLALQGLSAVGVDFSVTSSATLNFTSATTYVKYLQIDNKIFALSNAGEAMRIFYVGTSKSAKRLNSIEVPAWSVADKLSVVHPDGAWITSGTPTSVRTNLIPNPNFEIGVGNWSGNTFAALVRSDTVGAQDGSYAMRLESLPQLTNLCPYPLRGPVTSTAGWAAGSNADIFEVNGGYLHISVAAIAGRRGYANSPYFGGIVGGNTYYIAFDVVRNNPYCDVRCLVRYFASNGALLSEQDLDIANVDGRPIVTATAPAGATAMQFYPSVTNTQGNYPTGFRFRNVLVGKYGDGSGGTYFDGDSGANYFWTGTPGASASVYHPPQDIQAWSDLMPVVAGSTYTGSAYIKAGGTVRGAYLSLVWYNSSFGVTGISADAAVNDSAASWTRRSISPAAPAASVWAQHVVTFNQVPRGEYHYVDAAMFEKAAAVGTYFDGSTSSTSTLLHAWSGAAHGSASTESVLSTPATVPSAETKTANTLIGSGTNTYNFGFFYTFANEVGESAASQVTVVRTQRGWGQWKWETPNAAGEPSGSGTTDPLACADQLVAIIPQTVYNQALAQGAISWKLYMMTWSDQDPAPVTAVKVAERKLASNSLYGSNGWLQATPQQADATAGVSTIPNQTTRYNYSTPSSGGQGLVASDRMVLVNDPNAAAVIRWSSNQQGSYTDFSANKGGGYKTLTSGNLFVPACVKLWQNPQSVDTLTILCTGVDGHSTGYYMAPAQVAQQSEAVNIMGFEETTATPGTTSPYGCEVLNNALYHPLDELLMKSTATNYNINHSSMTDVIQDQWLQLVSKHHIVSSQHDNRIYYLVHNPEGAELEEGCWGNEVWVLDAAQKQGTWSRWLVQGQSLRKIELGGKVVMSLTRPDGIYYFDPDYANDDYVDTGEVLSRAIPWRLETNTQGANRAHDAWAHLQQANIVVGFFQGQMRYGIRGYDLHGKPVDVSKVVRDNADPGVEAYDLEDYLLIRRVMKEWFFYAESIVEEFTEMQEVWAEARRNLFPSPNAEVDIAGWESNAAFDTKGLCTFERSSEQAHTGTYSIKATITSLVGGTAWIDRAVTLEDTSQPITFSAYVYSATGGVFNAEILFKAASTGITIPAGQWTRISVTLAEPEATLFFGIVKREATVGDVFYVDDVMIEYGSELQPYFDGGTLDTATERYSWVGSAGQSVSVQETMTLVPVVIDAEVRDSAGQISLVQYRYAPSTVNTGYEYGSVETFEYGRSSNAADARTTDSGVPMPYIDTRRP
jgi:hypothetical protein